ncbi:hypothetical protein BABINDRAFT_75648 [Babjeviella inositovora NRRL Y-12698]|uniref:Uncharacterized protein n=1 Tax=Babjeviella inositovora NRRL Y-12698 TaxID=984486 RepID=A0A1E3R059_9ASCO|nr:uncharacterized protein BABINDRAFT_75648 [Babjeviella inositovora NRRL Y-12698]ODQ82742.1 hypothetical protein BABINDRAFT_75648 [Babjeviella inositovora NRRL Y-12698]
MPPKQEDLLTLKLKHLKSTYFIRVPLTKSTIGDVKTRLTEQLSVTGGLRLEDGSKDEDLDMEIPKPSFDTGDYEKAPGVANDDNTVTNILAKDIQLALPNDKILSAHALIWLPVAENDKTKLELLELSEGDVLAFKLTLEDEFRVIVPLEDEEE